VGDVGVYMDTNVPNEGPSSMTSISRLLNRSGGERDIYGGGVCGLK